MTYILRGCPVCRGDLASAVLDPEGWECTMCGRFFVRGQLAIVSPPTVMAPTTQRCATCGETMPLEQFGRARPRQPERKATCKHCCKSAAVTKRHADGWRPPGRMRVSSDTIKSSFSDTESPRAD